MSFFFLIKCAFYWIRKTIFEGRTTPSLLEKLELVFSSWESTSLESFTNRKDNSTKLEWKNKQESKIASKEVREDTPCKRTLIYAHISTNNYAYIYIYNNNCIYIYIYINGAIIYNYWYTCIIKLLSNKIHWL